jgi:uncharacterized protein
MFTEQDLERLEALLDAPPLADHAPGADALQALLVALAIGPDDEAVDGWLDAALGLDAPPGATSGGDDDALAPPIAQARDLVERFREEIGQRLRDGTLSLLLYPLRRGRPDYGAWCHGFLAGVELCATDWYDAADPEDVDELLFPIHVLAGELTPSERAAYAPAAWRRLVLDAESGLDATIVRIRDYWAIVRSPPQTVRHAAPKVGRNDPCPCGSGRKFKQCCGR